MKYVTILKGHIFFHGYIYQGTYTKVPWRTMLTGLSWYLRGEFGDHGRFSDVAGDDKRDREIRRRQMDLRRFGMQTTFLCTIRNDAEDLNWPGFAKPIRYQNSFKWTSSQENFDPNLALLVSVGVCPASQTYTGILYTRMTRPCQLSDTDSL